MKRWDEFPENTWLGFLMQVSDLAKEWQNIIQNLRLLQMKVTISSPMAWKFTRVMFKSTLEAILRGYIPMTMSISKMSTIPVDFHRRRR